MKCVPCNGLGLISSHEVCSLCKGIGQDGLDQAVVEAEVRPRRKTVKKAKKK